MDAAQIKEREEAIDLLRAKLRSRHIDRLCRGTCTIELGVIFEDVLTDYERVSDHCRNIAVGEALIPIDFKS
jgi:phosphate:Na+ symporter